MDDKMVIVGLLFFCFCGFLIGHSFGEKDAKAAIEECQKELPRNVQCKIIAVPLDKN